MIKRQDIAPQRIQVKRWHLKTVLQNIINCAVRIVRYASGIELHFGKYCLASMSDAILPISSDSETPRPNSSPTNA